MEILKSLLGAAAPMVATALGGPAAGLAVKFLAKEFLGKDEAPVEEIVQAVQSASPDQLANLDAKYEQYIAETERLRNEQGDITDTLIAKVGTKAASKIALLRMTTRPKVVLRMSWFLMTPLYIIGVDVALSLLNIFVRFFHEGAGPARQFDLLATTFFAEGSVYVGMYEAGVAPAATIVVSYMTLRQIEKSGNPFSGAVEKIKQFIGR